MADLRQVYQKGIASLSAAYQQAVSDYHYAQAADDVEGMAEAGLRMAGLESTHEKFTSLANRAANPQPRAAPVNKYGLTADEAEVARNFTQDPNLTEDQKMRTYAANRDRLRHMRATGQYRDDQGMIKR